MHILKHIDLRELLWRIHIRIPVGLHNGAPHACSKALACAPHHLMAWSATQARKCNSEQAIFNTISLEATKNSADGPMARINIWLLKREKTTTTTPTVYVRACVSLVRLFRHFNVHLVHASAMPQQEQIARPC